MRFARHWIRACLAPVCFLPLAASAAGGQLIATGGLTQIEGTAGGGIVPWAVLAGYATADEVGGTVSLTHTLVPDYSLSTLAANYTIHNRVEFSIARQSFTIDSGNPLQQAFGLGGTEELRQDIVGVKVRAFGDLIYGSLPQVSVGAQYKHHRDFDIPESVGARSDSDVDAYISASRLLLAAVGGRNLLLNGTLRATRANETGLLGFGGPEGNGHEIFPEVSIALFLDHRTAIGVEYRTKPDNLGLDESDWADVFITHFPSKHLAVAAAWVDLGEVGTIDNQRGLFLSIQGTF